MDSDISYILTIFIGLYLIHSIPNENFINFLSRFYHISINFFDYYNDKMFALYFNNNKKLDEITNESNEETKIEIKYEDKYLSEIRNLNKEFVFDNEEENLKINKYLEFIKIINESYSKRIDEINHLLKLYHDKLENYESIDNDYCLYEDEDFDLGETRDERINLIKREKSKLLDELEILKNNLESKEGQDKVMEKSQENAHKFIISQRLEKLKNCFIIEHTPLGNVLMIYDTERESFKYYSDNNIPYRYLEVVSRKYVKQFNCRPIFVDMEDELKLAEEKLEKDRKEKEEKEQEEKRKKEEAIKNQIVIEEKKNVFAKFKQYNKTAGTGHVNSGAPPKNSIPNKSFNEKQENEKILLKEKANRYTYEGKIANFNFLKKVDKKVVNKKMAITFADFKKMQQKSNKI